MTGPGLRHTRYKDHVLYRLVAAELRQRRFVQKVEQSVLARALGMTQPAMNRIELAHCRTSLLVFVRQCRALALRPGDVLDEIVGWIDDANIDASESLGAPLVSEEREGDMGAREDYMTMRRAAQIPGGPGGLSALLRKASASEAAFIRLAKAGIQNEMINLAWAVIGEPRPGGPAVEESTGG